MDLLSVLSFVQNYNLTSEIATSAGLLDLRKVELSGVRYRNLRELVASGVEITIEEIATAVAENTDSLTLQQATAVVKRVAGVPLTHTDRVHIHRVKNKYEKAKMQSQQLSFITHLMRR